MKSSNRNTGHRQLMIFFTLSFLFLITFGAGLGMLGTKFAALTNDGQIPFIQASVLLLGMFAIFLFLAIFTAHHVLSFAYHLANSSVRIPARNPNEHSE